MAVNLHGVSESILGFARHESSDMAARDTDATRSTRVRKGVREWNLSGGPPRHRSHPALTCGSLTANEPAAAGESSPAGKHSST